VENDHTHTKKHHYDKYLKKLRSVIGKDQLDIHNQASGWQTRNRKLQLPACLNGSYAGFGGNHGVRAGVKIQCQFSLTDGITKTEVVSATTDDQKTKIIEPKKNELHLFDLGYFSLKRLQKFDTKNAFYLYRLKIDHYGLKVTPPH